MTVRVLICDDDALAAASMSTALRDLGFVVKEITGADECIAAATSEGYDVAVIDLMMPSDSIGWLESKGGFATGIAVARRLLRSCPGLKIVGMSQSPTSEAEQWFKQHAHGLLPKSEILANPSLLGKRVTQLVAPEDSWRSLQTFIVHGHDHGALRDLELYLTDTLGLMRPHVIARLASTGRTIIEQLEEIGDSADIVFVLMTPDDVVTTSKGSSAWQARPNVFLETGYFLGLLARRSGRVILLASAPSLLPSDLLGLRYVDISNGVHAAKEEIRREIEAYLHR